MSEEKPQDTSRTLSDSSDTCNLQFTPVVQLPEVEVITNEENETIMLKTRAKLYRLDRPEPNLPAEWKERGIGELKILKNNDNFAVRIVMRRDKTFKVCANHFITPTMDLKPSPGSDKAFIYTVLADFADEIAKCECLAIKFANVEDANTFKKTFDDCKMGLLKECCLYNGECDKDSCGESGTESDIDQVDERLKELNVSDTKNGEQEKTNGNSD